MTTRERAWMLLAICASTPGMTCSDACAALDWGQAPLRLAHRTLFALTEEPTRPAGPLALLYAEAAARLEGR